MKDVIDIGCGGGRNAAKLIGRYPGGRVTAVDYSEASVEKAARFNRAMIDAGRCIVKQDDASDLRLKKDCFDPATAFETVYFRPGLERCFSRVAGVLRPGYGKDGAVSPLSGPVLRSVMITVPSLRGGNGSPQPAGRPEKPQRAGKTP